MLMIFKSYLISFLIIFIRFILFYKQVIFIFNIDLMNFVKKNTAVYFRIVLMLAFLGHAFVNLGFSPSIDLHKNIILSVFPQIDNIDIFLQVLTIIEVVFAVVLLFNILPKLFLILALIYLSFIGIAGWIFYFDQSGSVFGFAEIMRRFPWLFFILFLLFIEFKGSNKYHLLRIGISFAFLSHGTASLGLMGLNQGHIELAVQIVPEQYVRGFVFYTGLSDMVLGVLLFTGILSRYAAFVGSAWLVVVVGVSFAFAFPDGIFRAGFLMACIYVILDERCHHQKIFKVFLNEKH